VTGLGVGRAEPRHHLTVPRGGQGCGGAGVIGDHGVLVDTRRREDQRDRDAGAVFAHCAVHEDRLLLHHCSSDGGQRRRGVVDEPVVHLGQAHVLGEEGRDRSEEQRHAYGRRCIRPEEAGIGAHLVVVAEIHDAPQAELGDAATGALIQAGEVAGSEEHAAAGHPLASGQPADVAEVHGSGDETAELVHDVGAVRGGTGYRPAMATRLNALIEITIQLSATYSASERTEPTRS